MRASNVLCSALCCIAFLSLSAGAADHVIDVGPDGGVNFVPDTLHIQAGDTVTWRSVGGYHSHNVVGPTFRCSHGCDGEGGIGNPAIDAWSFTRSFATEGTVDYYCEIHVSLGMSGTIVVEAAPPPAPTTNAPGGLTGLWWNPNESGWGAHFTQRRNILFAAWYTYDGSGNPMWYVSSSCAMPEGSTGTSGTCNGTLYSVTGPAFFGVPFDSSKVKPTAVGTLQVAFQDANNANMTWVLPSQTRTVAITRQLFAAGATPAIDYSDLWWNPSESGWGMGIAQQANVMFVTWYVYDDSGKPMWYVASNCAVNGNGCSGTLYRTSGPPFGPTFNTSAVQVSTAGTVTLTFSDPNNGMLSFTVDGKSGTKAITRQLF